MRKVITLIAFSTIFISHGYSQANLQEGQVNLTSFSTEKVNITKELGSLTKSEFKTHPEYGVLPFNAPCQDCIELLQKRDETHRYFVKEGTQGKKFYQQTAYSPLSFYDKGGVLRTIDYRIKPAGQQGVFQAKNQPYPVSINIPEKFTSILNGGKELQMNRNVSIFVRHKDGSVTSLGEPDWSHYTAGDNGIVIHNFYPGIDLEMQVGGGNIETFYRLNKPIHLSDGWLVIRDNIKLPQGLVYDYSHSEKMDNNYYAGSLYINDQAGAQYFFIGAPSAYDENNQIEDAINLNYQIADNGAYDFYVPIGWMNDAKRSYPLIIDPFVTATTNVSASLINSSYNATCFSGGCATPMNVTVPPACTIVAITTTFWFRAFNPCGIDQGGWNITYGSCRFPKAGVWNTCGLTIPGLCQLTDLSCDSEFISCLPTPSCNPAPMAFTLNFARCTSPGSNCASSCITGDIITPTPWSVTVTGETVEVTAANSSTCSGSSASLVATPEFGAPPYTYTWYPGGLTGNPVNVSPSGNTTYTVTINSCGDTAQATATVTVGSLPPPIPSPDTTICAGGTAQLSATGGTSYSWSPGGQTGQTISVSPTSNTTYTVTATSGNCTSTATVSVSINTIGNPPPDIGITLSQPNTPPPYTIMAGDTVSFGVVVNGTANKTVYVSGNLGGLSGIATFQADSGNTTISQPFLYISSCSDVKSTPYHLVFTGSSEKTNLCGSVSDTTYSVDITVTAPLDNLLDSIPNIITPNGDNLNDTLSLYHTIYNPALYAAKSTFCWTNFHIEIFNRWGESQFESSDIQFKWNGDNKSGDKVTDGVYYYIITADFLGQGITKRGTVTVKR